MHSTADLAGAAQALEVMARMLHRPLPHYVGAFLKHYGPGPHPVTQTPQSIHAGQSGLSQIELSGSKLPRGQRVWSGREIRGPSALSRRDRLRMGDHGERVAAAVLSKHFETEFDRIGAVLDNTPIDLLGDGYAIEVKTGLSTVKRDSWHWRATLGEMGGDERALYTQMTSEQRREYNARKVSWVLDRKQRLTQELSQALGREIRAATVGIILSPSGRADVFFIPDFHARLGWPSYATDEYYLGTYQTKPLFGGY